MSEKIEITDTVDESITLDELIEAATKDLGDETSPYGVWKVMTDIFRALDVDQNRPSQMMYNYTRNGMIARRTKGQSTKGVTYTHDEVTTFLKRFISKHI